MKFLQQQKDFMFIQLNNASVSVSEYFEFAKTLAQTDWNLFAENLHNQVGDAKYSALLSWLDSTSTLDELKKAAENEDIDAVNFYATDLATQVANILGSPSATSLFSCLQAVNPDLSQDCAKALGSSVTEVNDLYNSEMFGDIGSLISYWWGTGKISSTTASALREPFVGTQKVNPYEFAERLHQETGFSLEEFFKTTYNGSHTGCLPEMLIPYIKNVQNSLSGPHFEGSVSSVTASLDSTTYKQVQSLINGIDCPGFTDTERSDLLSFLDGVYQTNSSKTTAKLNAEDFAQKIASYMSQEELNTFAKQFEERFLDDSFLSSKLTAFTFFEATSDRLHTLSVTLDSAQEELERVQHRMEVIQAELDDKERAENLLEYTEFELESNKEALEQLAPYVETLKKFERQELSKELRAQFEAFQEEHGDMLGSYAAALEQLSRAETNAGAALVAEKSLSTLSQTISKEIVEYNALEAQVAALEEHQSLDKAADTLEAGLAKSSFDAYIDKIISLKQQMGVTEANDPIPLSFIFSA